MNIIEDWVDRALSCFYRERDKDSPEPNNNETLDPAAEFSDEGKLRDAFEKFVAELGLNEEKRLELFAYSNEKKLTLLVSKNGQAEESVDRLLEALRQQPSPDLPSLQNLVIALRTQTESFLATFLEADGLSLLCDALHNCHNRSGREPTAFLLLCAFRALLNSEGGRQAVLGSNVALEAIARSVGIDDAKCKVAAVEVLSGLCFVTEEAHHQVLTAITQASESLCERTRFQHLVTDFHKRFTTDRETDRVRTAILGLFNALLRNGPAENSAQFRAHLRFELLMLGIEKALEQAKEAASSRLEDHIDLFEMMRKEDELTLSGTSEDSGASSPVDFESVVGMAEALHEKLSSSLAHPHFVSLLQHLFMVPCDERHVPLWRLFDLILQQLTLQTTVDGITDVRKPVTGIIDMEDVLARIQTQCDYEMAERELERLREELENERMRNIELENRLADVHDGRTSVSSGVSSLSSTPSDPCPPTPPPGPPLPPVCPPMAPPPPPPPGGLKGSLPPPEVQKKVPKPTQPLKTLNWVKLNAEKAKGTVWEFIEDEKMYKQFDLQEIDHTFAASSSHKDDDTETIMGTLQRRRETQVSVIDPRRFQNCTIMLSKLKLTHKEIKSALFSMDEKGKLPKDMIEQMLKFVPTREEMTAINEAVSRYKSPQVLALADRYLYEVSQIPRFEQRLRCLHIIRTFKDRVESLQPHISAVLKASSAMSSCKRFKQYLALILATGNYLNYGKRNGNAYGFDLSSLTRLADVKFSTRPDRNLMHYLLIWIDRKQPDMTKIKRELASVFEAARFNRAEVQSEMRSLEQAITIVRTELHFVNSQKTAESEELKEDTKKDRFPAVAKQFISAATADYNALEKQFSEMKNKFTECSRLFCFDTQASPEELFSLMAKFLNQLDECHHQQYLENEEIEKVKKQTIARSYFAKKSRRRDKEKDFDELINALQSGAIFNDDLKRLRTSFRVPKKTRSAKA